ncbi:hypothetical protein D3C72_1144100 [compost metagenome]
MQIVDHAKRREFADGKFTALGRLNGADHHGDTVFRQQLPHFAACAKARIAGQFILFGAKHRQGEHLIRRTFWQGKGGDFNGIVLTPHQSVPTGTKHREGVFADGDIQVEIVNGFTKDHARLNQLDFRVGRRWLIRQRRTDILHQ